MDSGTHAEGPRTDIEGHVEGPRTDIKDPELQRRFEQISNMFPLGLAERPVLDDLERIFDRSDSEFIEALTDTLQKFEGELADFLGLPIINIFGFLYFLFSVAYGPIPKLDKLILELILIGTLTPSDDKSSKRIQRLTFLKLCKTVPVIDAFPVIDALFLAMSKWIHNVLPGSSSSPDKIEFIISGGILVTLFARFLNAIITCFNKGDTSLTTLDAYYKEIIQQLIREFPHKDIINALIMWVSSLTQENIAIIQSTAGMPITDIDIKEVLGKPQPTYSTDSGYNIEMIREFLATLTIDIKGSDLQNELFRFFKQLFPKNGDLTTTLECFLGRKKLTVYNGSLAIGERQKLKEKRIHHEETYKTFASKLTEYIANEPKSTFTDKPQDTELVKNFFDLEVLSGLYPSRTNLFQLEFFEDVYNHFYSLKEFHMEQGNTDEAKQAEEYEVAAKQTLKFLYSLLLRKQRNIRATEVNTMTICKTYSPDPDGPMLEEIKFMIYVKGYISEINMTKRQFLSDYESKLLSQGDPLTYGNIVNCFMSLDTLIRYEGGLIIKLLTEIMKNSLTFGEILETTEHIVSSYQEKYTGDTFTKVPGKNIGVWSATPLSGFQTSQSLATMKTRNPLQPSYEVILQYLANKKLPTTDGVKLSLLALQTHTSPTPSKKHKSPVTPDLKPPSKKHESPVTPGLEPPSKKHIILQEGAPSKKHESPVTPGLEPPSKKHTILQEGGTKYPYKLLSTPNHDLDDFDDIPLFGELLSTSNDDDFYDDLGDIPLFGGSKIIFVKSIKKSIRVKTRRRKQQKQKSRKLRKQKSKKHKSRKQKSRKHKFL
jgi:hypothetical protein